MKKLLLISVIILGAGVAVFFFSQQKLVSPEAPKIARPLVMYQFNRLQQADFNPGKITLGRMVADKGQYKTYVFSYDSWGEKITGLANIPQGSAATATTRAGEFPVIVMVRGYVDPKDYAPGVETQPSAAYFAANGFMTLAPDFLGYGGSDPAFADMLQTRFDAPVEVLNLLAAIPSFAQADPNRIGIWSHSFGGQIALSVLEIAHKPYPTSLWAPVSKPFPESVLNYSAEMPDQGALLQKLIGDFEKRYDPRLYSITDFFKWIKAPLQVQQGLSDTEVPSAWSDVLVGTMASLGDPVSYYKYLGENHNFDNGSWQLAASRDLVFFKKWLF